jgi:hypothetical protein
MARAVDETRRPPRPTPGVRPGALPRATSVRCVPTATLEDPAVGLPLPDPVAGVVDGLARALRPRLRGRVLDLGTASGREHLAEAMSRPVGDHRFDTIVSVCGLVHLPDLFAAMVAIDALLDPDGSALLVEPVDRPVPAGLVLGSLGALHPRVRGLHVNRDVPSVVRRTSLTVVDIERIPVPTPIWPLRSFVALTAARVVASPADAADRS